VTILTVADQKGAQQIDDWVRPLKERYHDRLHWIGVADVTGIPSIFRNRLRSRFQEKYRHTVLLDWEGLVTKALRARSKQANVYLLDSTGKVAAQESGAAQSAAVERLCKAIDGQSALK
jgi:predicted transcriptional regulator